MGASLWPRLSSIPGLFSSRISRQKAVVSNGDRGHAGRINAGTFESCHGKNSSKTDWGAFGILTIMHTPVVIIAGASRGVGAATARWLADAGSAVTLISRSADALKRVAQDVQQRGGTPCPCPWHPQRLQIFIEVLRVPFLKALPLRRGFCLPNSHPVNLWLTDCFWYTNKL